MTDFYCPAAWRGGFYTFEEQSVCCAFPAQQNITPLEYIKSAQVRELKSSLLNGQPISRCASYCQQAERDGIKSLRQNYQELYQSLGLSKETSLDPTMPEVLEIRLGNLCNFSCRMCEPKWSSSISKELQNNPDLIKWYNQYDLRMVTTDYDFIEQIKQLIPHVKMVTFTGGEPTITKGLIELLKFMIDENHAHNIRLQIVTNCSAINPHLLDHLTYFKGVQITASLDAVGRVAEYQRHGTIWQQIENNVHILGRFKQQNSKINVNVNTALTAYNVLDLSSFVRWYLDLYRQYRFSFNVSFVVDNLSLYALAGEQRIRAIDELTASIELLNGIDDQSIQAVRSSLLSGRDNLNRNPVDTELHERWKRFTRDLDHSRAEDFEDIFQISLDQQIISLTNQAGIK